jgi:ribosomal protein L11 methyltransferase
MDNQWIQIKVTTKVENLDELCAVMSMFSNGLQIEDYSDIEDRILDGVYGDLIDESVLNADRTVCAVSIYVSADKPTEHYTMALKERLDALKIAHTIDLISLCEDDWANSWKQYYKPIEIGDKLIVVPAWENVTTDRVLLKIDPGMSFGTGSHETTRGIIQMLENCITDGCTVLDVGCGSGILAICAAKYGAGLCRAYDIDPIAVEVAAENAIENGCEIECAESDLLAGVKAEQYDVICANIVADIIIRMAPDVGKFMKDTSTLLASGIITERAEEVTDALEAAGLYIVESIEDNGWCALAVKKLIK